MGLKHGLKSNKWRAIHDDTTLHLDPCRTTVDLGPGATAEIPEEGERQL